MATVFEGSRLNFQFVITPPARLKCVFQDFDSDKPRADDFCGLFIIKLLEKNPFPLKHIRLVNSLPMTLLSAIVNPRPLGGGLAGFSR